MLIGIGMPGLDIEKKCLIKYGQVKVPGAAGGTFEIKS
jgi:hypothetical protein